MSIFAAIAYLLLFAFSAISLVVDGVRSSETMMAVVIPLGLAQLMWMWAVFRAWSAATNVVRGVISALLTSIPVLGALANIVIIGGFGQAANDTLGAGPSPTPVGTGLFRAYPFGAIACSLAVAVGSVLADHGGRGPGELAMLGGAVVVCLLQAVVLARLLSTAKLLRARTAK